MNPLYCLEVICFDNDNDALIPEIWAREALRVLMSNMVMGNLVNRDFSNMVRNFGDVVNTSRPADFTGKRKVDGVDVDESDAVSPNIPVPLDQHVYVSFFINDGEMSKALPNLVQRYLEPAAREMAEKVDQILCGQVARLATYDVGGLNQMDASNADTYVLNANTQLDINRAPKQGRNLVLGPRAQQSCLQADLFVSTERRGDAGSALYSASLGHVYGMDSYMDQNVNWVDDADVDWATGVTDNAEAVGDTVIETTVAQDTTNIIAGCYVWFEEEGSVHRISSLSGTNPEDITLTEGLTAPLTAASVVKVAEACFVNLVGGYAADWSQEIALDGFTATKFPQVGQLVTFGTGASSHTYTVIAASETDSEILLDRPLSAALANNDPCFPGPAGGANLAFTRDAVALVNRPLITVPSDTGARCFVADYDGLAMRVTMQYDSKAQGMRVTFDLLCGVAILDERLAVRLLS